MLLIKFNFPVQEITFQTFSSIMIYPLGKPNTKYKYRHSSIYADNMGTQKKNRGSKNHVNQGYLVVKREENRIEL